MTALPPTTRSRLKKLPQTTAVWEGDRRPLENMASYLDANIDADEECIIWVDGSEGSVRAMDVVSGETGIEATVRTLLRAIESPHHPGQPSRPQKVIVRDREIQFLLRGVLQALDITVEYSTQLPVIDHLFEGFAAMSNIQPSALPSVYEEAINDTAINIWDIAPWELLADSDILCVELKNCAVDKIYLCIMGMMSAEYGVLLYRSLDSLKQFRAAALGDSKSPAQLEQAFLAQDCWFLNYDEVEIETQGMGKAVSIEPFFGSIHPFEGMRPFLDEEETKIVYAALESLLRFYRGNRTILAQEPIKAICKSYRINLPESRIEAKTLSTKVCSLPKLTEELLNLGIKDRPEKLAEDIDIAIQEDLIPDGSLISLTSINWEFIQQLKHKPKTYHQSLNITNKSEEFPIIFIQTTRPKAKHLITRIKDAGGLKSICFNPGEDPFSGEIFQLGMLQTGDDELYIFAEYSQEVAQQLKSLDNWRQRCQKNQGYCGLIVAMGATGVNRGNPQLKDILALFEVQSINGTELGMGVLQLVPDFDF
ncbi:hypothetical protein [Pleurocapsa sp. PCC 7319]|uniref:DUF6930 domain-containing protein n=1 Tax=Pleurocapsa sp. PCC 7319 TaxID=118161 RepID=UPI0003484A58|nr:hypothetical protein [Pleurocapsa sp. PCC 7319]